VPATATRRRSLIHPTAVIHPNVALGDGCTVGPFCELGSLTGEPLFIGDGAIIRSHTVIYGGSEYGPGLETGHHVLLRKDNTVGANLRVGSYSSLEGGGRVGDYVRVHGRCEMTKGELHHFARVYGGSYITDNRRPPSYDNDLCILGVGSVVTMGCILVAGITVGAGAYVSAGMVVDQDVPPGHLLRRDGTLRRIRPENIWPPRYRADYPAEAQRRLSDLERLLEAIARES
jgi:acetyltransferase-like isoleucine patch superfamily enzyme